MVESKRNKGAPAPAQGEEVALQGLTAQYLVAAELVYRALNELDFESVILKDFEAEKVDDIQIVSKNRVDAYQVKWHVPPTPLTPSKLTGPNKDPESGLLRQLADGWKALSDSYDDKQVFVHLYTTSPASTANVSGVSDAETPPRHLAEFIRTYWEPETVGEAAVAKWQPFIQKLQSVSGLPDHQFEEFRLHCVFDLNRRAPQEREEYSATSRHYKDIEHLQAKFLKKSGEQKGPITLSRNDILELAGWTERFEFKARHDFPVTDNYVPIEDTVDRLEATIQEHKQGYLALLGSPGAGKSTLLTRTLRYRPKFRVIRYYCFIPDDTALSRGEAFNFLHDLVLALWNEEVRPAGHRIGDTIEQLRATFREQLAEIGNQWQEQELRTIVLIDGLDHISRESNPGRSLLNELPQPSAIPDGCLFILGSQTLDQIDLSPRTLQHLQQGGAARTITMGQLSRRAIREITEKTLNTGILSEEDLEVIESLSAGHPLALSYVLNRLADLETGEISGALSEIPPYADNIEQDYEIYWRQLDDDPELRELFALLSRMRGALNMKLAERLANDATVQRLVSGARHYFLDMSNFHWRFFHNSFRQFILDRTGRNPFDIADEEKHKEYHCRLAELAASETVPTVFRWDQLYHTYHAGRFDQVLTVATQGYFREQSLASRPASLVFDDLVLVMRAAKERSDILAAIRVLLIEAEAKARSYILDDIDVAGLLLRTGEREEAARRILQEGQLLIDPAQAMEFACDLADAGYQDLGREIFEAAEPLDRLSGFESRRMATLGHDVVNSWVDSAARFRSLEEVKSVISGLEPDRSDFGAGKDSAAKDRFREQLLWQLVDTVAEKGIRSEVERLPALLSDALDEEAVRERISLIVACSDVDPVWRKEKISYLLQRSNEHALPEYVIRRLAELVYRYEVDATAALDLFNTLSPLKSLVQSQNTESGIGPYRRRLRHYRLAASLGRASDPMIAVPDATDDYHRGTVLIERMVVRMAILWGDAWRGHLLPPDTVVRELTPAIRLIEQRDETELRHAFSGILQDYLSIAVHAAAAHGEEALEALDDFFEQVWTDDRDGVHWPDPRRRTVALELFRAGSSRSRLVLRLEALEPEDNPEEDVSEFHQSCKDQADAWIEIDELERAKACIQRITSSSFGVIHEKDTQLEDWARWFAIAVAHNAAAPIEDLPTVAGGIATASAYSRGRGSTDAAKSFLTSVATFDATAAYQLANLFWDEGVFKFLSAVEAFLVAGFQDDTVSIDVPFSLLCRLYVPYVRQPDDEVLQAFVVRLSQYGPNQQADEYLETLIQTIEREVSPKLRGAWWGVLDESVRQHPELSHLRSASANRLAIEKVESHHTKGHVILKDGTVIEEDDLLEQAKSPERLVYIAENMKEDSFHTWWRLFKPILPDLEKEHVQRICQAFHSLGKDGRDICGLIGRLHELGDAVGAEQLALKALEDSKSDGWSYYFDGGTRIAPYEVLVKLDGKYASQAFQQFAGDYIQGYHPYFSTSILDNLVSVFWVTPPYDALWAEVFEHFSQLREFSCPAICLPEDLKFEQKGPGKLTPVLLDLAFDAFVRPQPEVRQDVYKAFLEIYSSVEEVRADIASRIEQLLNGAGELPMLGMALIRGLTTSNSDIVGAFEGRLKQFLSHDDMALRIAAHTILSARDAPVAIKSDRPLSPVYTMVLPDFETMEQTLSSELTEPGSVLRDTNDPLQQIGIAQEALELIHHQTGLHFRNLVERTASLMRVALPEEEWTSAAEITLSNRSRMLGLETAYRRPRASAAVLALGRVIAELHDADRLSDDDLYRLQPTLKEMDSYIVGVEPVGRILSPVSITLSDGYVVRDQEWLDSVPADLSAPPHADQDTVILGFITEAEVPRWEMPSEFLCGGVCPPFLTNSDIEDNPEAIIPGGMMGRWWMAEQYPRLPYLNHALNRSLLIRAHSQRVEIGGASWLALNPVVGMGLGWSRSNQGLFRWVNQDEELMVETEWWRTGRLNRHAPADGVRAEGWIVKASRSGFEELQASWSSSATWAYGVRKKYKRQKQSEDRCWTSVHKFG